MFKLLPTALLQSALAANIECEEFSPKHYTSSIRELFLDYSPYSHKQANENPVKRQYKNTSVNVFTSSDSENDYSSYSYDNSGPSYSSHTDDSASSAGSESEEFNPAGDFESGGFDHNSLGLSGFDYSSIFRSLDFNSKNSTPKPITHEKQNVDLDAHCATVEFD